jgi:hypothetical protein
MMRQGDITILNKDELRAITERECRRRLKMKLNDFIRKRDSNQLDDSPAVFDINMLLKLAKTK